MGKMGWKTITGSILLAVGGALKGLDGCAGVCETVANALLFAGTILVPVGIRHAMTKLDKSGGSK